MLQAVMDSNFLLRSLDPLLIDAHTRPSGAESLENLHLTSLLVVLDFDNGVVHLFELMV